MIKKLKPIYPEEEIIDGFSILCFETHKKLEKFSSSLNKNVQRMILNEINRPKTNPSNVTVITPSHISEIKNKINSSPISPTRVTAQRKSKPDMNALTLAICSKKRRLQITSPSKSVESSVSCREEDLKCADKENEDVNKNEENLEIDLPSGEHKIKETIVEDIQSINDYCRFPIKDDSIIADSSVNATSTLSPISANCLQGDTELMDLLSPHNVDLDPMEVIQHETLSNADTESVKEDIIGSPKIVETPIIGDCNNNDHCEAKKDKKQEQTADVEDDDCVIISVGFDPAPKLSCIPLCSVEHMFLDIPKLKPAPQFVSPPSIRTILLHNCHKSTPPPPLIPAPAYYFHSSLTIYKSAASQSSKPKCISQKTINSPKLKYSKRCLMKSSILKTPPKCVKSSSVKDQVASGQVENLQNPVVRSILQNTNAISNTKLYTINTLKKPTITPFTSSNSSKSVLKKPALQNFKIPCNQTIVRPVAISQISGTVDNKRTHASLNTLNNSKRSIIRKTLNHIDIAHWISRKVCEKHGVSVLNANIGQICKPRVLKPMIRPYSSMSQIPSMKTNQIIIPENGNNFSFNFNNKQGPYRLHKKIVASNNSFKQHANLPVFIRPLNSVNTNFTPNSTVFLNSVIPSSVNYCSRPNLLLLQ